MKFHYQARYLKLPSKLKKFDELPIIPIQLETRVTVLCLVDSGASKSYIHGKFGDHLGLDVESGNKFTSEGVTGHKFVSYIHKIKFWVGGWEKEGFFCFTYELGDRTPFAGILGRDDFFNLYKVCFNHRKRIVELKDY